MDISFCKCRDKLLLIERNSASSTSTVCDSTLDLLLALPFSSCFVWMLSVQTQLAVGAPESKSKSLTFHAPQRVPLCYTGRVITCVQFVCMYGHRLAVCIEKALFCSPYLC